MIARQKWLASNRLHGDKISLHKYDEAVTYWQSNGRRGLSALCRGKLGQNMTDYLDILARNAFGASNFVMFSGAATGTSDAHFDHLTASHIFDADDVMKVWLKASMNMAPMANNPTGPGGTLVAITSPGVVYDIQNTAAASSHWKSVQQYTNQPPISQYEVGQYKQARFLQSLRNILWNAGTTTSQTTVASDVTAGDGAPAVGTLVRGAYRTGGISGATNSVALTDASGFSVGDVLSFHKQRESDDNRAMWDDPVKFERTVYSISGNNVTFELPITRDLTASDTWYVTLGLNVHMTVFIAGPNGVVAGVGQRPMIHTPPPVDDFEAMMRFSWDANIKYQLFRPEHVYVVFSAGSDDWG
tara:strand:+ start:14488 stop:15561 length:1074 start_codon:yes stop_codon:yes gene_type:complete